MKAFAASSLVLASLVSVIAPRLVTANGVDPAPSGSAGSFTRFEAVRNVASGGEMLLNGDFEDHSFDPGCHFHLTNAEFVLGVANVVAFGDGENFGVMVNEPCLDELEPQSGSTKVSITSYDDLYEGLNADAFGFELATPVVAGERYSIQFYAQEYYDPNEPGSDYGFGEVEIGVSTSPFSFGTLVFSAWQISWDPSEWVHFSATFEAPVTASYLTVRAGYDAEFNSVRIQLDNFSLVGEGSVAVEGNSWGRIKSLFR
jgi:hypothetical protein